MQFSIFSVNIIRSF